MFDRQRRKSSVDNGVDMDGLQAGLEKLAMKPKVGWMDVQVSCQRSSNYQENTLNAFHKVCYCGVYFFYRSFHCFSL